MDGWKPAGIGEEEEKRCVPEEWGLAGPRRQGGGLILVGEAGGELLLLTSPQGIKDSSREEWG